MAENKLTAEEFEERYVDKLDTIAGLIMSHPEIPEEVDDGALIGVITTVREELSASLNNRVPEIVKLNQELEKLKSHNKRLQTLNQELYMKASKAAPDPAADPANETPPKLTYDEIKRKIESI